jgi:hypothetical protein
VGPSARVHGNAYRSGHQDYSLQEKPEPNPINVNLQNNTGDSIESTTDKDLSYEERLARIQIQAAQEHAFHPEKPPLGLPSGTDPAQG